jgi:hypothetical protein
MLLSFGPEGAEFRVNAYTASEQRDPAVDRFAGLCKK